jgi:hypothetical protein
MQALLRTDASRGLFHLGDLIGGENLSGGAANGTPRNWLTVAVAKAMEVVVPINTPDARVTSGRLCVALTMPMAERTAMVLFIINIIDYTIEDLCSGPNC